MSKTEIQIMPTGPIIIPTENVVLKDAEGNEIDTEGKPAVALCRCGGSGNTPFCDGSHAKEGWQPRPKADG